MPDSVAFIPGIYAEDSFPLGRFLPPVPHGVISTWLQANIPSGAWIIDPFCTSPYLAVEAAQAGYHVLAAANNPIERFLLELFCQPPTADELRSVLADLAVLPRGNERIEPYIRSLYRTTCPHCGAPLEAQAFIWDRQSMKPVSRLLSCPACQNPGEYPVTQDDLENANRHSAKGLHWFRALERVAPMHDPDRQHAEDAMAAYLPRTVDALFTLVNRLDHFPGSRQRLLAALLLPVFDQANTLWAHPPTRSRPRQLTQPAKFRELNVWHTLEETINSWNQLLESRSQVDRKAPLSRFPELAPAGGVTVYEGRLRDLAMELQKPEAETLRQSLNIQAVYAALPRPNQAYWTLSTLWAGWLWGSEMTESFKSVLRRRRYDWGWHCTALTSAFSSLATSIQPETPFLAISDEGEPGLVSASLLGAASAGFNLQGLAIRKEGRQLQIHWKRGNLPATQATWLPSQFQEMTARIGNRSLHTYLARRGEPASYVQLHSVMLSQIVKSPEFQVPQELSPAELLSMMQATLQHTTTQDPALVHIGGGERTIESGRWYIQTGESESQTSQVTHIPLSDQAEMDIVRYLQEHPGSATKQVDLEICRNYPGVWTPEAGLVAACLSSYGEANPQSPTTWILREQDTPTFRHADLRELALLLDQIGRLAGYSVRSTNALSKYLRPAILWEKEHQAPDYFFYITASAVLSPVILHAQAYLATHPSDQPKMKILVTPGGRANLIQYKMEHNPILKNAIDGQWRFLKFRSLRKLAESSSINAASLDQMLSQDPVEKTDPQIPLF